MFGWPNPNQLNMEARGRNQSMEAEVADGGRHEEQVREARETDEHAQLTHHRRVRLVLALVVIVVVVCIGLALLALSGRL